MLFLDDVSGCTIVKLGYFESSLESDFKITLLLIQLLFTYKESDFKRFVNNSENFLFCFVFFVFPVCW